MKDGKGHAEINGARLYYEIAGSGHPVVFIHGNSLDTRMWDDQFHVFSERFRVIRYDVRGFGKSTLPEGGYSHVEDLKALLDYLEVSRAHLIGLSMGGRISIDFALVHPNVVSAIVAADCTPSGSAQSEKLAADLARVYATARENGVEAARWPWLELEAYTPAMANPEVAPKVSQMVSDYSGWHWMHQRPGAAGEKPALERLEDIKAPTLIVVGEYDMAGTLSSADVMKERIPSSMKIVINGVGHLSNMEAPRRFNEAVLDFLAEV